MNNTDRRGLPHEDVRKLEEEDRSTQHMSQVLLKLQSRLAGDQQRQRRNSTLSQHQPKSKLQTKSPIRLQDDGSPNQDLKFDSTAFQQMKISYRDLQNKKNQNK